MTLCHAATRATPRVRELVCATGNPYLFPELNIPNSTLRGWLNGEFTAPFGRSSLREAVALRERLHFMDDSTSGHNRSWHGIGEVYFGRAEDVPSKVEVVRRTAREARATTNRATT